MFLTLFFCILFIDTATTEIYTLSLHDALPIWWNSSLRKMVDGVEHVVSELIGRMPVYALTNTNPLHFDYFTQHMPLFHRRSEEHTSELQSRRDLVCRLLLEKKK